MQLACSTSQPVNKPFASAKGLPRLGGAVVDKSVFVPEDLPPGINRFRVALLDPETSQPAVLLAIKGRQSDGWCDLGSVEVKP
jgi:hypothetical protein